MRMREFLKDSRGNNITDPLDKLTCYRIADAITNDGWFEDEDPTTVMDLITTESLTRFVPTALTMVVREALEPELLINRQLFQPITMKSGTSIQIGSIGGIEAAEIPEGAEYPERMPQMGPGDQVAAMVSKKGVRISITEEAMMDSNFDIITLFLRQAGYALARLKERKAWQIINEMGVSVFDNASPSTSELGVCTGRGIDGAQNGAMTANDIFDMYAYQWQRGFQPDTLIMHPMAWKVFAHDPTARELFIRGNTVATRRLPQGTHAQAWGTSHNGMGARTTATGSEAAGANPWVSTLNPLTSTFESAPNYLPSPITILVTPNAKYTSDGATSGEDTTDIAMVQSNMCGLYIRKEDVTIEEWNDPSRDLRNLKIKERYGHAVLEQGKAIAIAFDVPITRHYSFDNVNSAALSSLDDGKDGSPVFA